MRSSRFKGVEQIFLTKAAASLGDVSMVANNLLLFTKRVRPRAANTGAAPPMLACQWRHNQKSSWVKTVYKELKSYLSEFLLPAP